jgi:murein DD-endopeptidase MepM/ murein hydrolase activator NlpD
MAQQLPLGSIQPAAQPVNTFFQVARSEPAAPAKPLQMPGVSGISTIGTGGTGGFSTPNSYRELTEALAPFSKELMGVATQVGSQYVQDQYQRGVNEALKANRLLQGQVEQSSEQYAADNRKLARTDGPGALLMDSMNPYRRGGIQAGLAQTAASDVGARFLSEYQKHRATLAELPPGSPEIVKFQSRVQSEVLKDYGLDTSMPAVQKYYLDAANKSWEKITDLQWDDNQKLLKEQTPLLIIGEVSGLLRDTSASGVVTGYDAMTGAPITYSLKENPAEAQQLLAAQTTAIFDKYAKRMGIPGEAIPALKKAWEELWGTSLGEEAVAASQGRSVDNSFMRNVLAQVQIGSPVRNSDGTQTRPAAGLVYGQSAVADLLKFDAARYEAAERSRKRGVNEYEAALAEATIGIEPGPALEAAIKGVNEDPRFKDSISAADKAQALVNMIPKMRQLATFGMDPAAPQQLLNDMDRVPLQNFDPKAAAQLMNQMLPNVPDDQKDSFLKSGQAIIRRRTEEKAKFDPLVGKAVEKAVVKEIAERYPSSILEMSKGGKSVDIYALRSNANSNIREASYRVETGLMKHVQNRLLEKEAQFGAMTAPQKQAVIDGAIEEYTNGKTFGKLFPGIGGVPNANGTPSQSPAAGQPAQRNTYQGATYSSSQLRGLSESDLRGYAARPLLTDKSISSELENAANGRGFSADLTSAARRAGVAPLRMLEEQLKFYPTLGVPKQMLDDIRAKTRTASGGRAAAQQVSSIPQAGPRPQQTNWLMRLLTPPAAAATLPPSYARYGGSYSSGGGGSWQARDPRGQSLIAMASRNGWDPADIAAIISFETGGTLNPSEPGRGAAAGRIGLIQAGPNERRDYGLGSGNWNQEMTGIERYLKARGAKPGMGLADLYATVNGGNPGAGYTADGNGTVARSSSTMKLLEQHKLKALNRLGMSRSGGGGGSFLKSPRGIRDSEIGSGFGSRESFRRHDHEGADVRLGQGTPLGLAVGGQVLKVYRTTSTASEANGGYGNYMDVRLANGRVVRLAHLSEIPGHIRAGALFSPNQLIARSGGRKGAAGSGRSTGPHLHLELLSGPMGQQETLRGKSDPVRNGAVGLLRIGSL